MTRALLVLGVVAALPAAAAPATSAAPGRTAATGWSSLSTSRVHDLDHPVAKRARKRAGGARRARRGRVVRRLPAPFRPARFVARPGLVPAMGSLLADAQAPPPGVALPQPVATPEPTAVATPDPGFEVPDLPDASARSVAVVSREWSFTLSQPTVRAGKVRVEFDNTRAEDPHELDTRGAALAFGRTAPGARQVKTVTLGAGSYVLYCPLPQHEGLGMKTTLVVEP